ncbi:MAG: aspartyl-trna synthetase [Alphaproteobacteria bacterium]|nr:aspartyl-trna synthetase [Alphaproteobacteria bacterium]
MNTILKHTLLVVALAFAPNALTGTEIKSRGSVTNLPLPRFVSLKSDKGNVRRGPSLTQRIDWVFKREDMPLEIIAEYGNWRRVRDIDGAGGWMHYALLSGVRTVIVLKDFTPLRITPVIGADPNAYAEQGVVAFLGKCLPDWCKISAGGESGWALKSEIWGVTPDEVRE